MQIFKDLVECKNCRNNINNKCILYGGKDVNEKGASCYNGIDMKNKQIIVESEYKVC